MQQYHRELLTSVSISGKS